MLQGWVGEISPVTTNYYFQMGLNGQFLIFTLQRCCFCQIWQYYIVAKYCMDIIIDLLSKVKHLLAFAQLPALILFNSLNYSGIFRSRGRHCAHAIKTMLKNTAQTHLGDSNWPQILQLLPNRFADPENLYKTGFNAFN